ncbi:MAG: FixH family protein [Methylovirgula sp.]|uniref:FixH family protein n=1 Tax=Methylovirgula sp. TaxID=1978224 RepID=UPI003075EF12
MTRTFILAGATAFVFGMGFSMPPSFAAEADYRFELIGQPQSASGKDIVQVRLVRASDGKPVTGAVIFESTADMGPSGMATMPAPVKPLPPKNGVYRFEVAPGMTGTWALHLAAKVQGETGTITGTINANLVN